MTYNFDPDRWYDNQRAALDARRARGELDAAAYAAAMDDLERRYDEMQSRLNKSFGLDDPHARPG